MCEPILSEDNNSPEYKKIAHSVHKRDGEMLFSEEFSDFKILLKDGETIRAHKLFLRRADYFKNMFTIDCKENREGQVDWTEKDPDVVKQVLRFIYTNEVEQMSELAFTLLGEADFLQYDKLKTWCGRYLVRHLTIGNAADTLYAAIKYNCDDLKRISRDLIYKHFDSVRETEGWKKYETRLLASSVGQMMSLFIQTPRKRPRLE